MTQRTLIFRSLRFHARAHLGVLLGATVGSAALVGALVVGDSVRGSLRDLALLRLGRVELALPANDRFFRSALATNFTGASARPCAAALQLPGTAANEDASARANHVQVLGVDKTFWMLADQRPTFGDIPPGSVALNRALTEQLKVKPGDTVLLRIQKPSLVSLDAPLTPQEDSSVALRLKVVAVVTDEQFGRFGLQANQVPPFNAFLNLGQLQERIGQTDRANLLLVGTSTEPPFRSPVTLYETNDKNSWMKITILPGGPNAAADWANQILRQNWHLADAELELRELPASNSFELRSDRIFLDPPVVEAAQKVATNVQPILTYFVNELRDGDHATPYSMVTAMAGKIIPSDMHDDEILINDWLAEDLQAKVGDTVSLRYYIIGTGRALREKTNDFRVRGMVPLTGDAADRTLMPEFPGLAKAESSRDWDAGFPIQLNRIRDKDEKYWHDHRGTPKAFVTLAAGRRIWANRFGDCTALRFPRDELPLETVRARIREALDPASVGLSFQPVREQALAASSNATDFGQLFIGFSFFLISAALLLMALLFQFGLEQRATEIGTLLALGFRPRQVRRLLLAEGVLLALFGGILGAFGGVFYARAMLRGLTTVWQSAVGTSALHYHATPATLTIGVLASSVIGAITIWLALRQQAKRPARELLAQGADLEFQMSNFKFQKRSRGVWIGGLSAALALGLIASALSKRETASADTFFSAGALLLIAGLGFAAAWLGRMARASMAAAGGDSADTLTLGGLGVRSSTRRRKRSLATIALLACGVFLIAAIGVFRLDATADAAKRSSGTGGFALIGESALPVTYDLNSQVGRDFYSLNSADLKGVSVVPFRVRDGDDASCLNLNRAQKPRLLGVNPQALQGRQAFTFTDIQKGLAADKGWLLLNAESTKAPDEIPAIGDENSIQWALDKKIGDTVDYTDERGRPFKLRLVGALANSVLQGSLIIDEREFVKRFPGESGYRMFLIDAPSNSVADVSATLTRSLQNAGLELTPTVDRLNAFNAVQNTYLSTFQVLGGLGLLLGSAGLGVVVLRNVQERRGEFGLLLAVGFRKRSLQWLVLSEHGALLGMGLAVGLVAAAIGVLPALLSPGSQIPYSSLTLTLGAVLANGLLWTWLATRFALRGKLLDALRNN
jgi:putative ABC transport system permease protein